MLAFTVGFVVLILLGGIWLKNLEKKSRDRESLEPRD